MKSHGISAASRGRPFHLRSFFRSGDTFAASFRRCVCQNAILLLLYGYHIRSNSFRIQSRRQFSAYVSRAPDRRASTATYSEDDVWKGGTCTSIEEVLFDYLEAFHTLLFVWRFGLVCRRIRTGRALSIIYRVLALPVPRTHHTSLLQRSFREVKGRTVYRPRRGARHGRRWLR